MRDNLISPIEIYSRIKEEFKAYFNTNSIDDLLFPIWTRDCIAKFENTYRPIIPAVLDMYGHKCKLPCDFHSVREVWLCSTINRGSVRAPGQFYYQTDCRIDNPAQSACHKCSPQQRCSNCAQQPVSLPSLCDVPDEYRVTHKVQTWMDFSYTVSAMLKPGNFKTIGRCDTDCPNLNTYAVDTFDIIGDELVTSFFSGTIYLAYYGEYAISPEEDGPDAGYYLIPDNKPFYDYVYFYIRYMVYDQLFNQSTDETFNQMRVKLERAENQMWEAYNNARTYAMSPDIYGIQKAIVRSYNRFNRFQIPGPATRK